MLTNSFPAQNGFDPAIDFATIAESVARRLWGEPNPRLSRPNELRWGTHGSRSLRPDTGVWFDHETGEGGGVLDMVMREKRTDHDGARAWVQAEGYAKARGNGNGGAGKHAHIVATYDYRDEAGALLFQVVRLSPKDFRQRRPSAEGGWVWNIKGVRPVPYRLPEILRAGGATVFVVEGEKDADTLARLGMVATCNAGGAGKWRDEHSVYLRGRDVVVLPDNDKAGRDHAEQVARSLFEAGAASVRVLALPGLAEKQDVSDWLAAGGSAEELRRLALMAPEWRPARAKRLDGALTGASLLAMTFPEINYIVPGYLPEGLTILAGKPKQGKSWLALDLALAVAFGGPALGNVTCDQGDVLYLALEDNPRRLQKRLRQLLPPRHTGPERLTFLCDAPRGTEAVELVAEWCETVERPRLVVVDTFAKIREPLGRRQNQYEADYQAIEGLQKLAGERGIAVLLIHHTTKMNADDPFDTVSGTLGLTGAADTILVMRRDAGGCMVLHGRGRDLEDVEVAMSFDQTTGRWSALGSAADVRRSDERRVILDALAEAGEPMSPADIAGETGRSYANVKVLLGKMARAGEIERVGRGKYALAKVTGESDHPVTSVTSVTFPPETAENRQSKATAKVTASEAPVTFAAEGNRPSEPGYLAGSLSDPDDHGPGYHHEPPEPQVNRHSYDQGNQGNRGNRGNQVTAAPVTSEPDPDILFHTCRSCDGDGCAMCHGTGAKACPKCLGEGCAWCRGTGKWVMEV